MTAKPPSEVEIGGRIITVKIDPELDSWGEYHADLRQILISYKSTLKKETLIETLRHEMLHASLDIAGITYMKNYDEEVIVRCIDNIFHPAWEKVRKTLTR